MVLSVVNLQEAYAKALLVDRDALAAAQGAGDVLGGHEIAARRLPHRRPRPLCAKVRAERGAAADPVAALRASGYVDRVAERGATQRRREMGRMSTVAPIVDHVGGPLARRRGARTTTLDQVLLASHLLGADRAVANFGGGNTSAKGTATDHVGREVARMWVKGSGSDLATMGARALHAAAPRRDAAAVRARRDERRGHGRLPRALPARPRGAALVDRDAAARVRPGRTSTTRTPTRSTCSPARADGERARRECFGDEAAWIPYIRPGFTLAKQVGEAVRDEPGLKLVVLAKHGLVVWGDTAEEAYRRTIEVINRAADFVNERTGDDAALRRSHGCEPARRRCCASCCRRCAARSRASARRC